MNRKLTLARVAEMAGVTPATVSRALNPATAHLISQETARRIQELSDRLGFRPSLSARCTATGKTYKIGMILHSMDVDLCAHDWNRITCGVSAILQTMGYSLVMLRTSGMDTPLDVQVSRFLMSGIADAYITGPSMIENNTSDVLESMKAPLAVICDSGVTSHVKGGVRRSNQSAFLEVWKRIPKECHGRICFFSPKSEENNRMHQEFSSVAWKLDVNGAQAVKHVTFQRHSNAPVMEYRDAYQQARQMMKTLNGFDVIICPSDFFALGVMDAMTEAGRVAGKDVMLLGYGDLETFPRMTDNPVLSTISANTHLIAKELCDNLLRQLNGASPCYATVEASFIQRDTFF